MTPENLHEWLVVGCLGAGLGSDLYRAGQPANRTKEKAMTFVKAYRAAKQKIKSNR
nr:2-dehydro-3-deoxy-6-phosphogalactonate aldolase [Xenorhabdus mauleonii]